MKVYIGPWKNLWVNPYAIAGYLKYLGVNEEKREEIAEYHIKPICQWIYDRNPFKARKVKVRIDNYDVWDCSHTLSYIILPMLKRVKEHKHGFPVELSIVGGEDWDPQTSFDFYQEGTEEYSAAGDKRWDEILDKMIFAFQSIADGNWEDQYSSGETGDIIWTDEGDGVWDMDFSGDKTWDYEAIQRHQAKIDEGLRLFAQYFQTLSI